MKNLPVKKQQVVFSILTSFILILFAGQTVYGEDWVRFRGPNGSGVASETKEFVTEFGHDKNLNWKIELPGRQDS